MPPAAPATAAVPARRRILDTARRLFAAEGIQAAGVDRIVAEAQVVKATFYRHFPAKDDLVCAYLAELSERQLAALRRLPADAELPHALVEIVGGPPYRGSPFINAAAEYADPDHPVRRLIGRHRRAFRELLVALPAVSARPDPRAVAGLYLVLCDGLVAGTYLDPGTDRQQGALDTANSTNGGVTSAVQIGNGGRVTARARHDHPLAERLARAAIEEGGGFQARYVAAEAAHFQGRPGQAEQELAALAADAVSDAERARVALLRFDNAFFLRGRTDLRLIDDVADAITVPVWRDELLTRRFFVVGVNSGPRAAVEAGSAMLQRAGSEPLTAAHVMLSYNLVRLGRLDDASQLLSPPPAAERYPRPISLGTSGRCS